MDNKTLSIISYLTFIGWLVAYFMGKDKANSLLKYHLKQSLGLCIISAIINIAMMILTIILPFLFFLNYIGLVFLGIIIIGIINASNEIEKPLPLVGKMFENKFLFIS